MSHQSADLARTPDEQTLLYAESLARLIRAETVSGAETSGATKFHAFRELLKETFPALFARAEYTEFTDGFTLCWAGREPSAKPLLFMNHHDVVEPNGHWRYEPFSGTIAENRLWGRGVLDDKGGLWAMLQAAEELIREGFVPPCTVWFSSASTEESTGRGAEEIARWFEQRACVSGCVWTRAVLSSGSRSRARRVFLPWSASGRRAARI